MITKKFAYAVEDEDGKAQLRLFGLLLARCHGRWRGMATGCGGE
jgi:hypothetical protein